MEGHPLAVADRIEETSAMEAGAELIARARLICGEQHVLTSPTVLSTYRSDGVRRTGPLPLVAILPGSPSEVANVVAACATAGVLYSVRGAGTSRSGGAVPRAGAVLIVLTRMRRVIRCEGDELTLEAGVPLAALPPARSGGWVDPSATLGTIGGHIAETPEIGNLIGLELVRPDGVHARLTSWSPGYDLAGSFPGSRGDAGILVTATLRAMPRP
jgi:glycolate oxidase